MSKRKRYSSEYKHELVKLARRSKSSCRKIALEVGVNPALLTRWVREPEAAGTKAFPGGGTPRDAEVTGLKRELSRGWPCRQGLAACRVRAGGHRRSDRCKAGLA
ncbi:hypothetical protein BH11PSE14_BH11PSE14_01770 [soil metagenome]